MKCTLLLALCAIPVLAADPPSPAMSQVMDNQLKMVESEFVPLAEAMPAEKFGFAPAGGEFKGVRTFAQQVSHVAAVIYACSAAVLGEKNPTDMGAGENGPANLSSKEDYVKYLKGAFEYGHKAMAKLTNQNSTELVQSAFGNNKVARIYMANVTIWHSFDHYGQMVVYARMNGVVPPASR